MNLIGDLTVLLISTAMACGFWLVTRRLGRARRGAMLMFAGLAVLTFAASVDFAEHVPAFQGHAAFAPGGYSEAAAYAFYSIAFLVIGAGMLRWLPLLRRIDAESEARARAERDLHAALERSRAFNAGLEALARNHIEEGWDHGLLVEEAARRVSGLTGADRVSVWRLDEDGCGLEALTLYDALTGSHETGLRLSRKDNPAYFNAIEAGRVVCVEDALSDPVTAAFGPDYLEPTGVGALLDAPILTGHRVSGVICCEHRGGACMWTPEEVSLVTSTAQYLAVAQLAGDAEKLAVELKGALRDAEAASDAKSAFLANMSHELRTPLNGVLGMAKSLAEDGLQPAQSEKTQIILRSGRHLLGVLNDVLDLSRIEAGGLRLTPEAVAPSAVISDVCALFKASAQRKGLHLHWTLETLPDRVEIDPVRMRQVLSNLVANAVKFTDAGAVAVDARAVPDGADWRLEIRVSDTGCGISKADQARLFQRFSQADESLSRRHGGAGLGLVIARELARAMGGDIMLQSAPGEGSCFTLTLQAGHAGAPISAPAPQDEDPVLDGVRVLLVDDNEVNRIVARCFLEPSGAEVTEADGGEAALAAFAESAFDIVLLDVHMPGMGGEETLHRLRALPGGDTPVVALTADALSGDGARYRAAGMDDYVAKPVDRETLIAVCAGLTGRRGAAPDAVAV